MSKPPIALDPPPEHVARASRLVPIAALFLLLPVVVPLIVEAAEVCQAQWREMLGLPSHARTPMMDWIGEQVATARREFRLVILSRFQKVPWDPKVAIGALVVVMLFAIRILRA